MIYMKAFKRTPYIKTDSLFSITTEAFRGHQGFMVYLVPARWKRGDMFVPINYLHSGFEVKK